MDTPCIVRVLKADTFGRVELLDGPRGLVVRRVACGGRIPGSRAVAHLLMRRERRALERLSGVASVAELVDLPEYSAAPGENGSHPVPRDVLLRSWLEGEPLYAVQELPEDFFERLEDLVQELHDRGVCHNDLHKEPNVLVRPDGRPALVDFQLASCHRTRGRKFRTRATEDLRHVAKHRETYAVGTGIASVTRVPRRRSFIAATWMRCGKPVYNLVKRRLLKVSDSEPRRPVGGPWPRWGPPVGS
jgi:serine/threonine protein kinase